MIRSTALLAASAAALALAAPAGAQTPEAAAERLDAFLDAFGGIDPGYAVVVVTADEVLMNRADGVSRVSTGAPLTTDTPLYIASQTKAYMGLLAARLDAEGVLQLDSAITDYWPDLTLPDGLDASAYTLRDLLTHEVPIENGLITEIEAYYTDLAPTHYPPLIAGFSTRREDGFQYDNLGYNIYAAILESATGRSWRDWLEEGVLDPLGLETTSARTSDYSADSLAWNHSWMGEDEGGWFEVPPKADGMMQSAGGMMTSTSDMAVWLQTMLRGSGPAGSGLTSDILAEALAPDAETGMEDGRNAYELPCSHYALGWNVCDFEGHALYIHGGGYTGARSMMAFSPDLGVGVAAFANSDNMTGWLTSRTVVMYLQFLTEHEDAEQWAEARPRLYPDRIQRLLDWRRGSRAEARADAAWGGWAWTPGAGELAAYEGEYVTDLPVGVLRIERAGEGLVLRLAEAERRLEPAIADVFGVTQTPLDEPDRLEFQRDADGMITGFDWDGVAFRRSGGE